jgi:pilus assembly protein FimV
MTRKVAAVVFSLGFLQASTVMALGLGELKIESFLNEPLSASVDLLNIGSLHDDEIRIRLATREDFDKLGMERSYFLTSIKFEVVAGDKGKPRIVMTTDEAVLEPYLDFIVEARWPSGRLLREYTVLVDPPVFSDATPIVSASARVAEVEGIPAEEPAKKNDSTAVTSGSDKGTRVDVRQSDLGPGEMPQREFNAATADSPTPGSRYMIARDQTLWDVATKARPEGASVHQTMLDIQRLNPNAFINGNINRVKAGYIVYLPNVQDISGSDISSALAEVREQNEAWEQGRDAELAQRRGPSLRISADVEPGVSAAASSDAPGDSLGSKDASTDGLVETTDAASGLSSSLDVAGGDDASQIAALQQRLETLQRIVSVKNEQIAVLQDALTDNGEDLKAAIEADLAGDLDSDQTALNDSDGMGATTDSQTAEDTLVDYADYEQGAEDAALEQEETEVREAETAPAPMATPTSTQPAATTDEDGARGWLAWLLYGAGALILAGLAFLFVQRRRDDYEEEEEILVPAAAAAPAADVFSNVALKEPAFELDEHEVNLAVAEEGPTRGYGERKHDEYASDVEAADALAEADIYIAYGRHPQAIDLLNNALASEPGNPVYRLKLLEIYSELNDQAAAQDQLHQLRSLGDENAIARGEALLEGQGIEPAAAPTPLADSSPSASGTPGLVPNPLEIMRADAEAGELQAEFTGLEIEQDADLVEEEDDLDLSADFEDAPVEEDDEDELVIAADANGLSTKLDLARAYLDMGDDDGARQILEEVVAEGKEELRIEAQELLDRIG